MRFAVFAMWNFSACSLVANIEKEKRNEKEKSQANFNNRPKTPLNGIKKREMSVKSVAIKGSKRFGGFCIL